MDLHMGAHAGVVLRHRPQIHTACPWVFRWSCRCCELHALHPTLRSTLHHDAHAVAQQPGCIASSFLAHARFK